MHRYHIPQVKSKKVQNKSRKKRSSQADDPSIPGSDTTDSLHKAVFLNYPAKVLSLLQKGADPNRQLEGGMSPLHYLFFSSPPPSHSYSNLCNRSGGKVRNAIRIIGHLVKSGARLLPDSSGLTPISLALLTRSKSLAHQLVLASECSVDDVIHYNYFGLPKPNTSDQIDLLKHTIRLQKALLFHVKHGITPNHNPLDTNPKFLATVYTSQLTDLMEVYAYQFSSYLAVHLTRGKVLFGGIYVLMTEVLDAIVRRASNVDITKFFSLFRTLVSWLNSHERISDDDVFCCWQHMVAVLESELVRAKLECVLPVMVEFLRKFILPVLELDKVNPYDNLLARTTLLIIVLIKVVSGSEQCDIFPRKDQESVLNLLNRKHLLIMSIHYSLSNSNNDIKFVFTDIYELLDFALPYLFNLNERFLGHGTVLHSAAEFANGELLRYFLKAGVSPSIKDSRGRTFINILRSRGFYDLCTDICSEFNIQRPFRLTVLAANVYIRYRLPLVHLHRLPLLREFVVKHCSREECRQMCLHCYKQFYPSLS